MTSDVRLEFEPQANGAADQSEVLEAIAEALDGLAEQKGLGQDTVFRANLAVEELVLNAMIHGGASSDAPPRMDVALALGPDGLTIEVGDNGPAFNPLEDAPPAPDIGPGHELSVGGLGIHLVKNMVDRMSYRRVEGWNRITMALDARG